MMRHQQLATLLTDVNRGRLSRRAILRRAAALGLSVPALAALTAEAAGAQPAATRRTFLRAMQEAPGDGVRGGTLRSALSGEPPTLDEHQTTASIVAHITYNMYETLFTYDPDYQPIPMLVETHEVSEDGRTHTMRLRQGVPFHNGEVMTADDVLASINRWGAISGVGQRLLAATNELARVDDHTIEFRLAEPYGTILVALAHNTQACVIYPQSVIEAAGDEPLNEFIGTGPYRLVERQADRFIRFERFEEYAALPGESNGYGGHKYAYADQIELIPVPDEAARVAGLQAGDYHIGEDISNDQYETLSNAPGVIAEILPPGNWDIIFLNWESPIMSNLTMRRAFQAALNHEPMLLSGRGSEEFIRLDPGLMLQESPWHTTAGGEFYNINDPALARQYLEEAGYDGTPLRYMSTREYPYNYGEAVVAVQQLEEAGFVVDFQVIDWATLVERRAQPEEWEVFSTGHGAVPDPSQISYIGQMNQYPGWWSSEESLALAAELLSGSDFDTRYGTWEQIQENSYTEIPAIKVGDSSETSYRLESLGGWSPQIQRGIPYWNLWLDE